MRLQGETRELSAALTTEELEDRGADLAAAVRNADQEEQHLEGRKKAWKRELDGLKEDLKGAREEASKLAEIVRTGREKRDVACNWQYALEAGYAFLVRSDTQELVTHRKLRDEERQMEIGEPPFAEPTPEQLEEWLRTLPVNEEQALPEGHAEEVTPEDRAVDLLLDPDADESFGPSSDELTGEDHDPLLDPGGFADEGQDEDGNTLGGDEDWEDEGDDQGENDEEDYDEGGEDTPIDDGDRLLDEAAAFNPNPGISELAAMPDDQVARLARRK